LLVRASFRLDTDRADGRSVVEVVTLFDVRDQRGPLGLPSQPVTGQCARRRVVDRYQAAEEGEMVACVLGGDADSR
jgi:hypothetical protein